MRRILMLLTVALVMAATMVASAVPAFADKGGGGHTTFSTNGGDCVTTACQLSVTDTGKRHGGQGGGRSTYTVTADFGSDPPVLEEELSTQGGGKGTGGGNCTVSFDHATGEFYSGGNGKRCG